MSRVQKLRVFVNQRLNAAVEDIFGVFEKTITKYEQEAALSQEVIARQHALLCAVLKPQMQLPTVDAFTKQLLVSKEEVPPEQQQWSPSLDQEDPEPPHIKEEQEELWTSQEGEQLQGLEEADITKFPFTPVPVKSEDDEEEPQSSQLHQSQSEENREAEPLASTSTEQMKTEADGEDCGGPEPASNLDPASDLQPTSDDQLLSSHCSETSKPQSGLDTRKSLKKQEVLVSPCNRSHTGDRPFSCPLCGKTFRNSGAVRRHMTVHTREKPFSCSVCSKTFSQRGTVVRHMTCHTGVKPFGCSDCNKRFGVKAALVRHMKCHSGEKPFSCSFCRRGFRQSNNLAIHMRIHTGEKPYCCSVCGRRFRQKGPLDIHMRIHTGEKPFSCSVCGKRFRQRPQLRIHKCAGESSSK